ncbi:hypothetical protein SS50377_24169 [Spironucleus salmonicida]|nr:hypothetical protein SS50377_24169 [Spironucleus salmonicida]
MEAYTKFINIQQLHAINYKKVWGEFQQMQFKKGELVEDKIINENNSQNNEYMSDTIQAEVVSNESSEFDNEVRLSSSDQVSDDLDDE